MAFGTDPTPDGLANPPIDDLMKHADSKYALAIFAAKRARQIIEAEKSRGIHDFTGRDKELLLACRDIAEGKVVIAKD